MKLKLVVLYGHFGIVELLLLVIYTSYCIILVLPIDTISKLKKCVCQEDLTVEASLERFLYNMFNELESIRPK